MARMLEQRVVAGLVVGVPCRRDGTKAASVGFERLESFTI
jgi:hypothetical protein